MTPEEWTEQFAAVSVTLVRFSAGGIKTGGDVEELEGQLLDALDEMEYDAGVKIRRGEW